MYYIESGFIVFYYSVSESPVDKSVTRLPYSVEYAYTESATGVYNDCDTRKYCSYC